MRFAPFLDGDGPLCKDELRFAMMECDGEALRLGNAEGVGRIVKCMQTKCDAERPWRTMA